MLELKEVSSNNKPRFSNKFMINKNKDKDFFRVGHMDLVQIHSILVKNVLDKKKVMLQKQ